jgi:hypothetical protein
MAVKNFAIATVLNPYDAAAVSIVVAAGQAARFGDTPFQAVWWNSTDYGRPSDDPNVEVVTVTAIAGDTLSITRAQEGTAASAKNLSGKVYRIYQTLSAKMWNDLLLAAARLPANPTAQVGIAAVNGTAETFLRSDAAPPLDQNIYPTWTGEHVWDQSGAGEVCPVAISLANFADATADQNQLPPRQEFIGSVWFEGASSQIGAEYTLNASYVNGHRAIFQISVLGGGVYAHALRLTDRGEVVCGTQGALVQSAETGFLQIPGIVGTPTGVPNPFMGKVPICYDVSADKLWIFNGSWKSATFS